MSSRAKFLNRLRKVFGAEHALLYEKKGSTCTLVDIHPSGAKIPTELVSLPDDLHIDSWNRGAKYQTEAFGSGGVRFINCNEVKSALLFPLLPSTLELENNIVLLTSSRMELESVLSEMSQEMSARLHQNYGPVLRLNGELLSDEQLEFCSILDFLKSTCQQLLLADFEEFRLQCFERELKELRVAFEPVVQIGYEPSIHGYEVLSRCGANENAFPIRWKHVVDIWGPRFAIKLDECVFRATFAQLGEPEVKRRVKSFSPMSIFINVCNHTPLKFATLFPAISEHAREVGFPLSKLVLEISEATDIPSSKWGPVHLEQKLRDYRELLEGIKKRYGCEWALDDFGVDHSNSLRLMSLSPKYTKIDRAVIQKSGFDDPILYGIKKTVQKFNGRVIAEGVDVGQHDIMEKLKRLNIYLVQGHYFTKATFLPPLPNEFRNYNKN